MRSRPGTVLGKGPSGGVGLALVDGDLWAVTAHGGLWRLPAETSEWTRVDDSAGAIALTALNARLHIVDPNGRIRTRMPLPTPTEWTDLCTAGDCTVLTAHAGRLIGTTPGRPLRWRTPLPDL